MGMNHKVGYRSEASIAAIAARCWLLTSRSQPYVFDPVAFIQDQLVERGIDSVVKTAGRQKGKLTVKFFERESPFDDPAYVEFDPDQRDNYVTLHVDRKVWEQAKRGDSFSCEILTHEIGHVLLHDHYANAFSSGPSEKQKLFAGSIKEDFAEWQAITFTKHALIPNRAVLKFDDASLLSAATNTTLKFAKERLAERNAIASMRRTPTGDFCGNCGSFDVFESGSGSRCEVCGDRKEF